MDGILRRPRDGVKDINTTNQAMHRPPRRRLETSSDLQHDYRAAMKKLKQRKKSGEISDAAFDILAAKELLDYTGG